MKRAHRTSRQQRADFRSRICRAVCPENLWQELLAYIAEIGLVARNAVVEITVLAEECLPVDPVNGEDLQPVRFR